MNSTAAGARPTPDQDDPDLPVRQVADHIREQIKRGLITPGQRLVEADLVNDTGAARAKVREALRRLQIEGLVAIAPFRGASVRRLDRAEIAQIYAVREALEGLAARLAATQGAAVDRSDLKTVQAELDRYETARDTAGFADANLRWHSVLLRLAGNPVLTESLDRLKTPILRLLIRTFHSPDIVEQADATLRRVTEAVMAGDGDAAEAAMRAHVRGGLAVIAALDDDEFG